MMRGGSIFAKVSRTDLLFYSKQSQYCRQGISYGSRQCSSSARPRPPVTTAKELVAVMPVVLKNLSLYALETLVFKTAIFYVGYKAATYHSPFQPEKYAPEQMSLCERKQLLDVELKQLEEKEALLAQLEAQIE